MSRSSRSARVYYRATVYTRAFRQIVRRRFVTRESSREKQDPRRVSARSVFRRKYIERAFNLRDRDQRPSRRNIITESRILADVAAVCEQFAGGNKDAVRGRDDIAQRRGGGNNGGIKQRTRAYLLPRLTARICIFV